MTNSPAKRKRCPVSRKKFIWPHSSRSGYQQSAEAVSCDPDHRMELAYAAKVVLCMCDKSRPVVMPLREHEKACPPFRIGLHGKPARKLENRPDSAALPRASIGNPSARGGFTRSSTVARYETRQIYFGRKNFEAGVPRRYVGLCDSRARELRPRQSLR